MTKILKILPILLLFVVDVSRKVDSLTIKPNLKWRLTHQMKHHYNDSIVSNSK